MILGYSAKMPCGLGFADYSALSSISHEPLDVLDPAAKAQLLAEYKVLQLIGGHHRARICLDPSITKNSCKQNTRWTVQHNSEKVIQAASQAMIGCTSSTLKYEDILE